MARDLVFGNGRFYVAMDRRGLIRELCWPVVGAPNHLAGRYVRLGVRRDDGWFSWLGAEGWEVRQWYEGEVGVTEWAGFGMTLVRRCWLEGDGLLFEFECDLDEEIWVFQGQELRIDESDIGDTCYYDSETEQMVHFKHGVWVGFGMRGLTGRLDQVACGMSGVAGLEGTWRDAEDGVLSGKPIEQGSVDSVFGVRVLGSWSGFLCCGDLTPRPPLHLRREGEIELTHLRGEGEIDLTPRPPLHLRGEGEIERVIRANTGVGGRVVAAIDSDIMGSNRSNYAYVWMRDAVLTAEVMGGREDLVGFVPACDTGQFLWQKYHPMGYRGSTWHPHAGADAFPYQMDETALLVSYAYRHQMVDDRVKGWRDLLVGSLQANGLPRPSWDLWEERFGVHFWTCATVLQAYVDAGLAGKADAMRATMEGEFARVEGRIPRRLGDSVADASVLAGCLWCESLRPAFLEPAIQMVEEFLLMATNCGGVARYEGDYYCRVREGYPGNPWVICTMWLARGYWFVGRHGEAEELLQWVEGLASLSGMLSEQYHPDTREPLSVCPLTWSHAEYLETHRLVRG